MNSAGHPARLGPGQRPHPHLQRLMPEILTRIAAYGSVHRGSFLRSAAEVPIKLGSGELWAYNASPSATQVFGRGRLRDRAVLLPLQREKSHARSFLVSTSQPASGLAVARRPRLDAAAPGTRQSQASTRLGKTQPAD